MHCLKNESFKAIRHNVIDSLVIPITHLFLEVLINNIDFVKDKLRKPKNVYFDKNFMMITRKISQEFIINKYLLRVDLDDARYRYLDTIAYYIGTYVFVFLLDNWTFLAMILPFSVLIEDY